MPDLAPRSRRLVLSKRRWPAEVQQAIDDFERKFGALTDDIREELAAEMTNAATTPTADTVVTLVMSEFSDGIRTTITTGAIDGVDAGRRMASRRFDLDIDFETVPQSTLDELTATIDTLSDSILETMSAGLRSDIEDLIAEGKDTDAIADRLLTAEYGEQLNRRETQTHARTLVQGAAERGNHSAMQDAPGVIAERWNATHDGRARESHLAADGQIVPVDTPFVLEHAEEGRSTLMHPGDPSGPVHEVANCRCYATPVYERDLSDDELATIRAGNRLNAP